jgi:hypothetical protein
MSFNNKVEKTNYIEKWSPIVILVLFFLISSTCFGDVVLFNDKVIGNRIDTKVLLIITMLNESNELKPEKIDVYFSSNSYSEVVVYYMFSENNFSLIEDSLDELYNKSNKRKIGSERFKYWRNKERKIAVALTYDKDCLEYPTRYITITYKALR